MSNPYLLAVALSISALTAACSPEEKRHTESIFAALGASPVDLAETSSGEDEPIIPEPVVAVAPEPVIVDETCLPFTGEFRIWHCEDGVKAYP